MAAERRDAASLTPDFVRGMIFRLKSGDLDRPLLDATAEVLRQLLAENEELREAVEWQSSLAESRRHDV